MDGPWSITITPIPKSEDCIIHTSDGQEWTVKGLALFADGGENNLMVYFWNSPAAAASGCVRACVEAIKRGDLTAQQFYRCLLKMFAHVTGGGDKYISAEDLLRRWETEEKYQAVQTPDKKFN